MSLRSTQDIGRQGEFFAAYVLESQGVECHHVDRKGADLWCQLPSGVLLPVQVKASLGPRPAEKWRSTTRYAFSHVDPQACEWFCFVALDLKLLIVRRLTGALRPTVNITVKEFTPDAQASSLEAFLSENEGVAS